MYSFSCGQNFLLKNQGNPQLNQNSSNQSKPYHGSTQNLIKVEKVSGIIKKGGNPIVEKIVPLFNVMEDSYIITLSVISLNVQNKLVNLCLYSNTHC